MLTFFIGENIQVNLSDEKVRELCQKHNLTPEQLRERLKPPKTYSEARSVIIRMEPREISSSRNRIGGLIQSFNNIRNTFPTYVHLAAYLDEPILTEDDSSVTLEFPFKFPRDVQRVRKNVIGDNKEFYKDIVSNYKEVVGIDNLILFLAEKKNGETTNDKLFYTNARIVYDDDTYETIFDNLKETIYNDPYENANRKESKEQFQKSLFDLANDVRRGYGFTMSTILSPTLMYDDAEAFSYLDGLRTYYRDEFTKLVQISRDNERLQRYLKRLGSV
jgi:hypothetical protein